MAQYKVKTDRTWRETEQDLASTFHRWGVREWSAEANVPLSRVHSQTLTRTERGVTVRFMKGGREVVLSSDSQPNGRDNLKLIQLCIDDMRMIERRGLDSLMRSAYMQLEGPYQRDPYDVLGVRPGAPREVIDASYRALAKSRHPDTGGTVEAMNELNAAYEALKNRLLEKDVTHIG